MMRLPDDEYRITQQRLVAKAFETHPDIDMTSVPAAWDEFPCSRWCWHMLVLNGLDPDPAEQKPLTAFGIDLTFAPQSLRDFLFAIT